MGEPKTTSVRSGDSARKKRQKEAHALLQDRKKEPTPRAVRVGRIAVRINPPDEMFRECPDCGHEAWKWQDACPKCGAPLA